MKFKYLFIMVFSLLSMHTVLGQDATITEELLNMKTYMFGDPDPVPNINRIYPYFRFDGYTNHGEFKDWEMVVLENKYIKVYVCPSIGGKIWGAFEKSTGKEFLYFNDVVKFRDVAMRGAWTSGGLEYNFGDIGHIPSCSTPVDYVLKEFPDGSVSCTVGATDLPSRTKWNVEILLQKDKAFFETKVSWANNTSIPVTYYHWMNAAAKASGDLEFIYPGNKRIGHGGELGEWPIDGNRDISRYENNDFGIYKSYHVINSYSNFFGGYWHEDDFGFGHYSSYDDKPGKKIWIWGLSQQGMIWEDLLTDSNGQYIEFQAGKLFNQAANSSSLTPFKHREFSPYDTNIMHELWFPLVGCKGMLAASEYGVLNIERSGNNLELSLSPLQPLDTEMVVRVDSEEVFRKQLRLSPLQLFTESITIDQNKDFVVELGNKLLVYDSNKEVNQVNRPSESEVKFDWTSSYGLYMEGLELEKQRRYSEAHNSYLESFTKDSSFIPTLNRLALAYYRQENFTRALEFTRNALAIDTYDGLANYLYGLINAKLGKNSDAKSGFSISAQSLSYRSASYTELAKLFLKEGNLVQAEKYTEKALAYNAYNLTALEIEALIYRKENRIIEALNTLSEISEFDPTSHFINFERYLLGKAGLDAFKKQVSNELPAETFLELASKYMNYDCEKDALKVLEIAPENPITLLWRAFLDKGNESDLLSEAMAASTEMVFPHRYESGLILKYFEQITSHWKIKYYLGLQQWNAGNIAYASSLFKQCGDAPNSLAFYLAKIKLFDFDNEITLKALTKADEINPDEWRLKLAWMEYYDRTNQLLSAKKMAKETYNQYPKKAVVGMQYARTLLKLGEYDKCLDFLEKFEVLPFEGATEGRDIYHETCIRLSLEAYLKMDYVKAISFAEKAKLWPVNLGVGKHYDVDERMDNYLLALSHEKLGNTTESELSYSRIMLHTTPAYLNESSKLYFQLAACKKFKNQNRIIQLTEQYSSQIGGNIYTEWALAKFNKNNAETLRNEILNSGFEIQVYDTKFVDVEFRLVSDIAKSIGD